MKKRYLSLLIFSLAISVTTYSQQKNANISFSNNIHDFGEIKEADGTVSHKFEFVNTGNEPLIVQKVTSSCGCTTPSWTREPVMPGEKGFVSAAYNPKNRPGHFDKYINVQTNSATSTVRLRITGKVIPKPLSKEEIYRYAMGDIRLKTNHLSFGSLLKGTQQRKIVEYLNNSDKTHSIEIRDLPDHLKVHVTNPNPAPGETGEIQISYFSEKQDDWDFMIDRLNVYIDGQTDRNSRLIVSANIQEDFSSLSAEERAKAAHASFDNKTFSFEKIRQGEKLTHEYKLTNTGKSDLIIRKVNASCGCTAVVMDDKVIGPGETTGIKVTFNSAGKLGKQNKTVTVITNDPDKPREILWIRGEIVK